jgi:hypothetical protein
LVLRPGELGLLRRCGGWPGLLYRLRRWGSLRLGSLKGIDAGEEKHDACDDQAE